MPILNRMNEWHKSTWEFIVSIIALVGPPMGMTIYCAYQVAIGNGLEQFQLEFVDIPKFLGAGASFLDVLILNCLIVIAIWGGLGYRYYYYRHERDFIKKYNIDADTGFKSIFKSSSRSRGNSNYDNDGGDFGGGD